jgi:hypothetical protein
MNTPTIAVHALNALPEGSKIYHNLQGMAYAVFFPVTPGRDGKRLDQILSAHCGRRTMVYIQNHMSSSVATNLFTNRPEAEAFAAQIKAEWDLLAGPYITVAGENHYVQHLDEIVCTEQHIPVRTAYLGANALLSFDSGSTWEPVIEVAAYDHGDLRALFAPSGRYLVLTHMSISGDDFRRAQMYVHVQSFREISERIVSDPNILRRTYAPPFLLYEEK